MFMALWYSGVLCQPVTLKTRVQLSLESPKNVTSYDSGRVVLVNKPFFLQVEDKRTCVYDLVVELA